MPRKKVGQPLKHIVHTIDGKIVDGLKYDIQNDTHYAYYKDEHGTNKKKNFGRNKEEAISKFRSWEEERQGGKLVTVNKYKAAKYNEHNAAVRDTAYRCFGYYVYYSAGQY